MGSPWRWAVSPTVTAWEERLGPTRAITSSSRIISSAACTEASASSIPERATSSTVRPSRPPPSLISSTAMPAAST